MRHNSHLITPAKLFVLSLLLVGSASLARSQCRTLEDCQRQVSLFEQIKAAKDKEIENLNRAVQQLQADNSDANAQIEKLKALQAEKEREIAIHEQMEKTLQDSVAIHVKVIENREEAIKDRDTVIKELVKVSKRSALEKMVDVLPSITGIIALALVK